MKKSLLILVLAGMLVPMAKASVSDTTVLMTVGGEPVTVKEFKYIYEKNNQDDQVEKKGMKDYLDLFIKFRLKVKEGEMQGKDTTESFKKELAGYRAQAAAKYLRDTVAIDSLIRMSYERMTMDRRAAHIVVACPKNAPDSAQQAALKKINEIRDRVTKGKAILKGKGKKTKTIYLPKEDFKAVAAEVSEDPGIKENGGELGWITVFRYVYPFEDAVYTTPVGEVTKVFRSNFGYHIALVEEERDHQEVRARHIMKMAQSKDSAKVAAMKVVTDSLYQQLKNGADFAKVAESSSDDKGSAARGGELGWFGRGMMVPTFETAAFAMKDSGEISEPVQSPYGWLIIQLEGKRGVQGFDEIEKMIASRVNQDERIQEADKSFIRKTRAEYQLPDSLSDDAVRDYADKKLEDKYEDFRMLVQEYHDGILLFDVSLAEVWDKASQDEAGLTQYFKEHKSQYNWDKPHWKGYVLECKNESAAKAAKAIVKSAPRDSVESYLKQRVNNDSVTYVKAQFGIWEKGQKPVIDQKAFKDKSAQFTPNEKLPVVVLVGKMLKNPEEYRDVRTQVVTDYQDALEAVWVEGLRKKYEVKVNEAVLDELLGK